MDLPVGDIRESMAPMARQGPRPASWPEGLVSQATPYVTAASVETNSSGMKRRKILPCSLLTSGFGRVSDVCDITSSRIYQAARRLVLRNHPASHEIHTAFWMTDTILVPGVPTAWER